MTPAVSIVIVTWNSIQYLPELFGSIDIQSQRNFEVIVIDNGSADGTVTWIRQNQPDALIIENSENKGFATANNQGIRLSKSPYVLLCNSDITLSVNLVEQLYNKINSDHQIGSIGGKLLKATADLNNPDNSDIIDSTGIKMYRSRRAVDRGENMKDSGYYSNSGEIFGISGALVMYRRKALDAVSEGEQYFDESFFSYKEDVDLAWRLQLAGFKSFYLASAIALHARGASMLTDLSDKGTLLNRKQKSKTVNHLSYRNHLYMLIKNESWTNLFFNPYIVWYEFKKFTYLLFSEPTSLRGVLMLYRNLPLTLKKRKYINSTIKIDRKDLSKWFQ